MKRLAGCIVLVLAGALVASCDSSDPDTVTNSDSNTMVLINADVVTMDDSTPTATAIACLVKTSSRWVVRNLGAKWLVTEPADKNYKRHISAGISGTQPYDMPFSCPAPSPLRAWRQFGYCVPRARDEMLGAKAPGQHEHRVYFGDLAVHRQG